MKIKLIYLLLISWCFVACQKQEVSPKSQKEGSDSSQTQSKSEDTSSSQKSSVVGLVDNSQGRYLRGCGCYYWKPQAENTAPFSKDKANIKEEYLFIHDMGLPGRSWIMLNGQLMNMYFGKKGTETDEKGVPHMIDSFYNGENEVVLDAIKATSSQSEDEVIHYSGFMNVKSLEGTEKIPFKGECGCESM
ncbi:MAG: hypothetical protein H7A32_03925 [Deltaproteobacteria bacterium]|nr:hypothetical protein [Deltaproteobacteria bacterium]